MLLFHATTTEYLLNILKTNKLTSNKINKDVNYGFDNYINDYIYLSCIPKNRIKRLKGLCVIIFKSDILLNKNFTISKEWTPIEPEINNYSFYKSKNINEINEILLKLFNSNKYPYQYTNQIAVKNKIININNYIHTIVINNVKYKYTLDIIDFIKINNLNINIIIKNK